MEHPEFVHLILSWYQKNKRELPWRQEKDPYRIWLSEIILQQTRVSQGLPYYYKFINEFPDITSLAIKDEEKVLRLWQGLGYYSRARNLHSTAKVIVSNYKGTFPDSYSKLLTLKGVGEYTAAAIASFAYDEKVPVIDGNVYRVLSRVFGISEPIDSGKGKKAFRELAWSLVPEKNCSDYNQGIMEFGALHCTPLNPDCQNCPLNHFCYAYENKVQTELPRKSKKIEKKKRNFSYLVYYFENKIVMHQRQGTDIWKGLYQFPLIEEENQKITVKPFADTTKSKTYRHILTHQIIEATFYSIKVKSLSELSRASAHHKAQVFSIEEVEHLPKPILIQNYLKEHFF